MLIERNVTITLRDGVKIYADVFRPADEKPVPPIIAWTPYGKHVPFDPTRFLNAGVKDGRHLEIHRVRGARSDVLDSARLCRRRHRHARHLVFRRHRALSRAGGSAGFLRRGRMGRHAAMEQRQGRPLRRVVSRATAMACRRAEPAASRRDQSVGRLDRHLSRSRDPWRHSRTPISGRRCGNRWGASKNSIEDLETETKEHPLFDDFWKSKAADFSKITAPAFVVASWTDQGLHTRGTFEGFKHIVVEGKISGRARPEEVGALLCAGEHAQAAGVLRSLSQGRRQRRDVLAEGDGRGAREKRRRQNPRRERMAAGAHAIHASSISTRTTARCRPCRRPRHRRHPTTPSCRNSANATAPCSTSSSTRRPNSPAT